jgi:hypothetical protein
MVATERESEGGDGWRVDGRRRRRVRRHEVQSITATAGRTLTEDEATVLLQLRGVFIGGNNAGWWFYHQSSRPMQKDSHGDQINRYQISFSWHR